MRSQNEDNLKELFEKFLSADEAAKAAEDVYKAEQIIQQYPAPQPDEELIARIKTDIAVRLSNKQEHVFAKIAYRAAAIAAIVFIVAAIGLNIFRKDNTPVAPPEKIVVAQIIPKAIWESNNIAVDDADLAIYTTEAERIEDELLALQFGTGESHIGEAVTELEMKLMEIESDFWKG